MPAGAAHGTGSGARQALAAHVRSAASTQLRSSMAMVMGPTPPGTGVMNEAFSLACAKLTSPTSR